jgi:hypothetical protein
MQSRQTEDRMPLFLQIVPVRDDVRDGSNVHAARRKQRPYENAFS